MSANHPNAFNEKQAVLEEIHNWARHVDNYIWICGSFFIVLNLTVIKVVLCDLDKCFLSRYFFMLTRWVRLVLAIAVFVILWLIPFLMTLGTAVVSENLKNRMKKAQNSLASLKIQNLNTAFESRYNPIELLKQLKYPFVILMALFTIIFLLTWVWIFCRFIP